MSSLSDRAAPRRPGRKPPRPRRYIAPCIVLALLAGCATVPRETIVKIPVAVHAVAPMELYRPIESPAPVFVAPSDPRASSALTPEGEKALKRLLEEMITRIYAWEAWGNPVNPFYDPARDPSNLEGFRGFADLPTAPERPK